MKKYRMNSFSLWMLLLTLMVILSGCNQTGTMSEKIELTDGKYLLSFSGGNRDRAIHGFSVLCQDGSLREYPLNQSIAIINALKTEDEYLFFSRQQNAHYVVSQGGIQGLSFLTEKYGDAYVGVLFASESNGILFTGVNVGFSEEGYICELIYWEKGSNEYRNITFYDKILCDAVYDGERVYVQYLDLNSKDEGAFFRVSGIMEINFQTQQVLRDQLLDLKFEGEPDRPLILYQKELVLYRPQLDPQGIPTGDTQIGVYKEGEVIVEFLLEDFIAVKGTVLEDLLYLVDLYGEVLVYNQDYQLVDTYQLPSFDEGILRSMQFAEEGLYAAFFTQEGEILIRHYDLAKGVLIAVDPVPALQTIPWEYENFTFLPL